LVFVGGDDEADGGGGDGGGCCDCTDSDGGVTTFSVERDDDLRLPGPIVVSIEHITQKNTIK